VDLPIRGKGGGRPACSKMFEGEEPIHGRRKKFIGKKKTTRTGYRGGGKTEIAEGTWRDWTYQRGTREQPREKGNKGGGREKESSRCKTTA